VTAVATTSLFAGTNGQVLAFSNGAWTGIATTTFSSGLAYSAGNVTNTGLLSLTQNGGGSAQTGAITLATSSATSFNGLTISNTITNSGGTFTFAPDTITGTLNVAGGGTGLASYTAGSVLYASGAATLAGTTTANLKATLALNNVENTALSTWAGTSNLTTLGTISTGVWNGTGIDVAHGGTGATSLTGLLQGNGTGAITAVTGTAGQFPYFNGTNTLLATSTLFVSTAGNVGIGTASPSGSVHASRSDGSYQYVLERTGTNARKYGLAIQSAAGSLTIDDITGSAADFTIDTSGNAILRGTLTQNSDARLKTNVTPLSSSTLDQVASLNPITFNWIDPANGTSTQVGFLAQDVQKSFPLLVKHSSATTTSAPDGILTVNYIGLVPYVVKAVQDIASIRDTFKTNLIAWLGNAENGIQDLFAKSIYAENGHFQSLSAASIVASSTLTSELCVDDVCVTRDQFKAMVESAGAASQAAAAAGAPAIGGSGAPASQPVPTTEVDADNITASTSSDVTPITSASSTPETPEPANDNPQPQGAEQSSHDGNASTTPPAANDNQPSTATPSRVVHALGAIIPSM
jgi:endosialidase-like protein